jgi:hypothetical protein
MTLTTVLKGNKLLDMADFWLDSNVVEEFIKSKSLFIFSKTKDVSVTSTGNKFKR